MEMILTPGLQQLHCCAVLMGRSVLVPNSISLCYYATVMRATFSIDQSTDAALRRTAERLGESKSAVVRRAVLEVEARCERLTEAERQEQLTALAKFKKLSSVANQADVDHELEELQS